MVSFFFVFKILLLLIKRLIFPHIILYSSFIIHPQQNIEQMIKNTQEAKKSFSKDKLNLLEKYIASKTIQKRTRPSQLNFLQKTIFTEMVPHQEDTLIKFKPNSHQRSSETRSQAKKQTKRYPDSIFMKEDLIKLGKINQQNRNECKVTKISMLLKKLVNQQVHSSNSKVQNQQENLQQNKQTVKKNLKNFRSEQIFSLFRLDTNVNLKLIQENTNHFKNQNQQQYSLHRNTTSRKNHVRYASTASKLKNKFKLVENNCLDTLKVYKCEAKQINNEKNQKNIKKLNNSKPNSPRNGIKMDLKRKDQFVEIKQDDLRKFPKMPTYRKSQSYKMAIQPWTNHQIILNDPIDMAE